MDGSPGRQIHLIECWQTENENKQERKLKMVTVDLSLAFRGQGKYSQIHLIECCQTEHKILNNMAPAKILLYQFETCLL